MLLPPAVLLERGARQGSCHRSCLYPAARQPRSAHPHRAPARLLTGFRRLLSTTGSVMPTSTCGNRRCARCSRIPRVPNASTHARGCRSAPDHRLAPTPWKRTGMRGCRLDALQQEHDRQQQADQGLFSAPAREHIRALAADFACVWNDERVAPIERKRMLALLIEKSASATLICFLFYCVEKP